MKFKSFTLLELLIVIAIIAIMASMLLPAISTAQKKARAIACTGTLKQIGLATYSYTNDFNDFLPAYKDTCSGAYGAYTVFQAISPYAGWKVVPYSTSDEDIKNSKHTLCPMDQSPYRVKGDDPFGGNPCDYRFASYSCVRYLQHKLSKLASDYAMFAEGTKTSYWGCYGYAGSNTSYLYLSDNVTPSLLDLRHSKGANYLFADGSVKWHPRGKYIKIPVAP